MRASSIILSKSSSNVSKRCGHHEGFACKNTQTPTTCSYARFKGFARTAVGSSCPFDLHTPFCLITKPVNPVSPVETSLHSFPLASLLNATSISVLPPDYRSHAPCLAFAPVRKKLRFPAHGASCRKLDILLAYSGRRQLSRVIAQKSK